MISIVVVLLGPANGVLTGSTVHVPGMVQLQDWQTKGPSWKAHEKKITGLIQVDKDMWTISEDRTVCVWAAKVRISLHDDDGVYLLQATKRALYDGAINA
jgi:hypothetical protein